MICPDCESSDVVPFGKVIRKNRGKIQRYACKNCGKTWVPPQEQIETTETKPTDGQDILMERRPEIDKINLERAKMERMINETQKFFEDLKKEFWVTDADIAELCAKLNDLYSPNSHSESKNYEENRANKN